MNVSTFITAVFIAVGFVGWPVIGSYSGVKSCFISIIVGIATAVTVAMISARELQIASSIGIKPLLFLMAAGIINGVAFQLYSNKVADSTVPTSVFIVTVSILMTVAAPFLSWMLKGAIPTFNQMIGFGFAIIAIYFLNK